MALVLTLGGVACSELNGSGVIEYNENGKSATRVFRCAWDDADTLAQYLRGSQRTAGESPTVVRPATFPGDDTLWCRRVRVDPFSNEVRILDRETLTDMIRYEWARVTASYGGAQAAGGGDSGDLFTESYDFTTEFLTLATNGLRFGNSQGDYLTRDIPLTKVLPGVEYSYERLIVPDPLPRAVMYAAVGSVNAATFREAAAETVMFMGASARASYDAASQRMWSVAYKFAIRSQSWNKVYSPLYGWLDVRRISDNTVVKPYALYNFNLLVGA